MKDRNFVAAVALLMAAVLSAESPSAQPAAPPFDVQEKTIAQIQRAIIDKEITTRGVVEAYLRRIRAYNGTCVNEPQGILGPITPIAHAGQINALSTLNLRPAAREAWKFDARKARSLTDTADDSASMPDALDQIRWAQQNGACAVLLRPIEGQRLLADPYFYPI